MVINNHIFDCIADKTYTCTLINYFTLINNHPRACFQNRHAGFSSLPFNNSVCWYNFHKYLLAISVTQQPRTSAQA